MEKISAFKHDLGCPTSPCYSDASVVLVWWLSLFAIINALITHTSSSLVSRIIGKEYLKFQVFVHRFIYRMYQLNEKHPNVQRSVLPPERARRRRARRGATDGFLASRRGRSRGDGSHPQQAREGNQAATQNYDCCCLVGRVKSGGKASIVDHKSSASRFTE